ncbi:MAG: hypothetical protein V1736_02580 [Pseudomonadota bacterium]
MPELGTVYDLIEMPTRELSCPDVSDVKESDGTVRIAVNSRVRGTMYSEGD